MTSKNSRGGRRYAPYVFTEQGVSMLSSVINSERAIEVNINIMRAFVKLRHYVLSKNATNEQIIIALNNLIERVFIITIPKLARSTFQHRLLWSLTYSVHIYQGCREGSD